MRTLIVLHDLSKNHIGIIDRGCAFFGEAGYVLDQRYDDENKKLYLLMSDKSSKYIDVMVLMTEDETKEFKTNSKSISGPINSSTTKMLEKFFSENDEECECPQCRENKKTTKEIENYIDDIDNKRNNDEFFEEPSDSDDGNVDDEELKNGFSFSDDKVEEAREEYNELLKRIKNTKRVKDVNKRMYEIIDAFCEYIGDDELDELVMKTIGEDLK